MSVRFRRGKHITCRLRGLPRATLTLSRGELALHPVDVVGLVPVKQDTNCDSDLLVPLQQVLELQLGAGLGMR